MSVESQSLQERIDQVLDRPDEPVQAVESRAASILPEYECIVWEGDATEFCFLYVSPSAERIFGHPASVWLAEPTFWADSLLHPDDREEVIANYALATGQGRDVQAIFRGMRADGLTLWLLDSVRIIKGPRGFATKLRGITLKIGEGNAPDLPLGIAVGIRGGGIDYAPFVSRR